MKKYEKDLLVEDELLFMENKLFVPAVDRGTSQSVWHEVERYAAMGSCVTVPESRYELKISDHSAKLTKKFF